MSDTLRWMGPARYNWSGFVTLLQNKAYCGEIELLLSDQCPRESEICSEKYVSLMNELNMCSTKFSTEESELSKNPLVKKMTGRFLAVNGFNIACRCQKVGTGPAPTAHLGDGCLDLVTIQQCSRISFFKKLMLLKSGRNQRMIVNENSPKNEVESSSSPDLANVQLLEPISPKSIPHYDLPYVHVHRVKAFRFSPSLSDAKEREQLSKEGVQKKIRSFSSARPMLEGEQVRGSLWCADGEALLNRGIFARVNRQLLTVYGCGPPNTICDSQLQKIFSIADVNLLQLGCDQVQEYIEVSEET
ncbi:hypothetical protein Ciccas_006331 [Cichlidogyrus casuarinus]|uniref:Uncharacterized protein n=1 Tax=Cichlidogyrus casuarinus TaxID=1844966 RepID=A0ABD2Q675_9PLAT